MRILHPRHRRADGSAAIDYAQARSRRSAWSTPRLPSFQRNRPTTISRAARPTRCVHAASSGRRRRQRTDPNRPRHRVRLQLRACGMGAADGRPFAVVVNNNPETVSTDFDISDALIFEPPGADEVEAAYRATNALGVMLAFGGQTAINLAGELRRRGVPIIGSDRASLDMAEDREQFDAALSRARASRVREGQSGRAGSARPAPSRANWASPCSCVRRSCSAAAAMEIVYNEGQLASYAESAPPILPDAPLLVDKYLRGPGSRGRCGLRRRGHSHSRHLRTHRTRRHPLGRLDQRLSDADDRCSDGATYRQRDARHRAGTAASAG